MNAINVMNEEYRVYYGNPFRKIWSVISSARRNLMRMESALKESRLHAGMQEIFEIKERYESDREREKVLTGIIGNLERRILEVGESSASMQRGCGEGDTARLRASLRRRTSELDRLRRRMADDLEKLEFRI